MDGFVRSTSEPAHEELSPYEVVLRDLFLGDPSNDEGVETRHSLDCSHDIQTACASGR